ncbi:phospholipid carrier-dependent glycosyltransferase [Paenibacillus sp. HJGM_3]|uniref:phospholipid carrier-dependent glycosyltransferase n=1 Tax=Paenibacillus sp. HJGM_3 TaxID=3379816 RepID=UPI00385B0EAC
MKKQLWRVPAVVWAILLGALLVRMLVAVLIVGHPTDMTTFRAWADYAATNGLAKFYSGEIFADYPPGYIYVLYVLGKIKHLFELDFHSRTFLLLVKMPALLADLIAAWLIYITAAKRVGAGAAIALTTIYAFNPAILVNSAAWGQVDSIFTLFIVAFVLLAMRGKLPLASIVFVMAVLIKPQGLIFTPVLLFALYRSFSWRSLAWSVTYGLAAFLVMILPFGTSKGLFWIVHLYTSTLGSYPYASLNAFNLFALLGGNWQPVTNRFLLSYETWGTVFIVLTVAYSVYIYIRGRKQPAILLVISLVIIVLVFVLTAKMHERYMYPALLLAVLAYLHTKDRRLLYTYIGLSLTQFVNVAYVLSFNVQEQYHLYRFDKVLLLTSAANVILAGYLVFIARGIGKVPEVKPVQQHGLVSLYAEKQPLQRKDWILIAVITLLYAIIAFYRLGDTSAPETYWKPTPGDSVVLDLGQTETIQKINVYSGIGGGRYKLETSRDGQQWEPVTVPDTMYGSVFTWNSVIEPHTGRYVRVTAESSDVRMLELGVFANDSEKPASLKLMTVSSTLPVSSEVSREDFGSFRSVTRMDAAGGPERLIDEQHLVPFRPTYMNSMYFDEIYHGRTAYEHLHLMEPYETTHPPMGKDIMMFGLMGFGMTPFGWRVVGTLVGVLMVPLMYIFAFRLFRSTMYATWATLLLVLDFMHFVQTRIGTVDMYTVLFVILMYYFMHRFSQVDMAENKLSKAIVPLFLSGLFFGFGIACKWNAVYGGLGLAALLAYYLYIRFMEYRYAKQQLGQPEATDESESIGRWERVVRLYPRHTIVTVVCAGLFFTVVPLIVYVASYIPFLMIPGPGHGLMDVVRFQKFMYDYHSKLVATHPFSSPWWAWMPMVKPVWYFSGSQLAQGKVSSIVAMGNPALWWAGIGAFVYAVYMLFRHRAMVMLVPVVAFVSLYLPWVLVPRLTFLYHFFPMMPFLILFVVYAMKSLTERTRLGRQVSIGYLVLAGVLFAMFYPVLSGMVADKWYVDHVLRWFPSWIF